MKGNGFRKVTPRRFVREHSNIVEQLWVDANGFGGKERTLFVLNANFIFDSIDSYYDTAGFRICDEETWDMSTHEKADRNMLEVVEALDNSELNKLKHLLTTEGLVKAIKSAWNKEWYKKVASILERWNNEDSELKIIAEKNRMKLKLSS